MLIPSLKNNQKINLDEYYKELFHPNLIKFVENYYDSFDYNEFVKENYIKNKKLYNYNDPIIDIYLPNIKKFLNTPFILKNTNPIYNNIKKVFDLPENELELSLECLGYIIGINSHYGVSFYQLYKKYLKLI